MKSEGIYEEIHARLVVRSEVGGHGLAAARVLDSHLPWLELNAVFLGFVDDRVTKIVVGVKSLKADARSNLRRNVPQVRLQFEIGDLTGGNLPANGDGQQKNGHPQENFGSSTQNNALHLLSNAFYCELARSGSLGYFPVANWIA
jgi:hypothetical protein